MNLDIYKCPFLKYGFENNSVFLQKVIYSIMLYKLFYNNLFVIVKYFLFLLIYVNSLEVL